MNTTNSDYKKILVPYLSRYYFYGGYVFPIFGLISAGLLNFIEDFASYTVLPLIFVLIVSLHRVSWGKRPRFGAHFTWAALGFSFPVLLVLSLNGNWLGAGGLAIFMVLVATVRRRFCRALTRLPKL